MELAEENDVAQPEELNEEDEAAQNALEDSSEEEEEGSEEERAVREGKYLDCFIFKIWSQGTDL